MKKAILISSTNISQQGRNIFSRQRKRAERMDGYKESMKKILAVGGELTCDTCICMEDLANDLFLEVFLEDATEL